MPFCFQAKLFAKLKVKRDEKRALKIRAFTLFTQFSFTFQRIFMRESERERETMTFAILAPDEQKIFTRITDLPRLSHESSAESFFSISYQPKCGSESDKCLKHRLIFAFSHYCFFATFFRQCQKRLRTPHWSDLLFVFTSRESNECTATVRL